MPKKKFYVVWKGHKPGVYATWDHCQEQIKHYKGAIYKSFATKQMAKEAYTSDFTQYVKFGSKKSRKKENGVSKRHIIKNSISVDAAFSSSSMLMEYQGVHTTSKENLFRIGPFKNGTNNIGEFLALVHALALCKKNKDERPIYSDSETAISWVEKKAVKTTLTMDQDNSYLFELIDRALDWLEQNEYPNQILKWETSSWGEIPADFGRK